MTKTQEFQAMLDKGGIVTIPSGEYLIEKTLLPPLNIYLKTEHTKYKLSFCAAFHPTHHNTLGDILSMMKNVQKSLVNFFL